MPPKTAKKAAIDDDIDSLFKDVDDFTAAPAPRKPATSKPVTSTSRKAGTSTTKETTTTISSRKANDEESDLLAELEGLTAEHRAPSRPVTPRIPGAGRTSTDSIRKRASEDRARPSIDREREKASPAPVPKVEEPESEQSEESESARSSFERDDPQARLYDKQQEEKQRKQETASNQGGGGGGGWWGGIWSTASAAVNTAQGVVKEIQATEEARKWTEQVKGSIEAAKGIGGELQKRAIPTFTNLLQHIAPPISSHERLHIHTAHDLVSYPSIDPIINAVFSRVMQQVDGGELMVIQRGHESSKKRDIDTVGWGGGPWWRDERKRDLGCCYGLEEGVKLVRVTAETFSNEYRAQNPQSHDDNNSNGNNDNNTGDEESNPVRKSDIFLAIQPTTYPTPSYLSSKSSSGSREKSEGNVVDPEDSSAEEDLTAFAIHLVDPTHHISFTSVSQAFPAKWGEWMDSTFDDLPEDMQMGLANGAVDPREWIAEWMEETLALVIGVVAQGYVSKRMGVGEGLGKGKERVKRAEVGEEARAL